MVPDQSRYSEIGVKNRNHFKTYFRNRYITTPKSASTHDGQWATSVAGLEYLAEQDLNLYPHMKQFQKELESQLNYVRSWLEDFEDSSAKGTEHLSDPAEIIEEVSSHPLSALRMIRRFVHLKKNLLERVPEQSVVPHLTELYSRNWWPKISDYETVMDKVLHIRFVYELPADDFMNGNISESKTSVGLTPNQVYEIVLHAERKKQFTEALAWLQPLIERNSTTAEVDKYKFELDEMELQSDVERISKNHDEILDNITRANYWDFRHRYTRKILSNSTAKLETVLGALEHTALDPNSQYDQVKFYKLCKGDVLMPQEKRSKLLCFYETKLDAAWLINPLKIEVYSWDPYLIRIYDVITEAEKEYLQNESKPFLSEATVVNRNYNSSDPNSPQTVFDKSRVASFVFLKTKSKLINDLESKIGRMTGLKVSSQAIGGYGFDASENFQVASYSFGGHYEYHHDSLPSHYIKDFHGNRIATFMIYLNDVKLGGHTAFPKIGIAVKPIRKSAAFWYNLWKHGDRDSRTLHGGCPVIIGKKWISNTWIRSFANFQMRTCSLNPDE